MMEYRETFTSYMTLPSGHNVEVTSYLSRCDVLMSCRVEMTLKVLVPTDLRSLETIKYILGEGADQARG